jgi:hypothetical protein
MPAALYYSQLTGPRAWRPDNIGGGPQARAGSMKEYLRLGRRFFHSPSKGRLFTPPAAAVPAGDLGKSSGGPRGVRPAGIVFPTEEGFT